MAVLSDHVIEVVLPPGWDGRLYRRDSAEISTAVMQVASTTRAVLHAASFPLPVERGDFGSGAVEMMRPQDVLLVLVEHDPEAAGTALFAAAGPPRRLSSKDFGPNTLLRAIPGQRGAQVFFSANGRAFCLYIVLGGDEPDRIMPVVNSLLQALRIGPG